MKYIYGINPAELVGGVVRSADAGNITVSKFGRTLELSYDDYDGFVVDEVFEGAWEKHQDWPQLVEMASGNGDYWVKNADPVVDADDYWLWFSTTAGQTYYLKKVGQ